MCDEHLVLLASGDGPRQREAFGELVRRHQRWLIGRLTFILSDAQLAADVAQDAFVLGYAAIERSPPGCFRPWLRLIATRLAHNRRRDRATRRGYHDRSQGLPEASSSDDRAAARQILSRTLDQLSCANREILALRYVEGLDAEEIAELLGIGLSAAKMRLKRARDRFRELQEPAPVADP